jgi:hypothetical protein
MAGGTSALLVGSIATMAQVLPKLLRLAEIEKPAI